MNDETISTNGSLDCCSKEEIKKNKEKHLTCDICNNTGFLCPRTDKQRQDYKEGYEQGKSDAIKIIDEELLIIYNTLQKGMRDCFEWEDGFIAGEETESFIRQLREWLNSLT